MKKPLFRKKSIERASSPEQLTDYIRVTNPGIWIVLAAVLCLLAGFVVWGVVGKLETKVNGVAVSAEGGVVCYVREAEAGGIEAGDAVRLGGSECTVVSISAQPIAVDEDRFTAYAMRVGGFSVGEWVYEIALDAELSEEGIYSVSIVTGVVSPISFLFG